MVRTRYRRFKRPYCDRRWIDITTHYLKQRKLGGGVNSCLSHTCCTSCLNEPATFKFNKVRSIFLRLPTQDRSRILKYVHGDRFVHLKHLYNDSYLKFLRKQNRIPTLGVLRHIVCHNAWSKKSFYQAYNAAAFRSSDVEALEDFLIESFNDQHYACVQNDHIWQEMFRFPSPSYQEHRDDALNLSLLSVCRKLYDEAADVL